MFLIATVCISIKLSNEEAENPFCLNKYSDTEVIDLKYEEIEKYDYHFKCSTLYFEMVVNEKLTKKEIISLLVSIGLDLNKYKDCFTHFQIDSESLDKTMYATINLKTNEVSYIE